MQLVSIILPYYKKLAYIHKTLDSIRKQTYKNYELVIIYDDTDLNDLYTLQEITKNDPKIKIIKNINNLGAGHSRNLGIEKAKGEFVAFIDADDEWDSEKINKQINFMNKNNYNFSFSNYRNIHYAVFNLINLSASDKIIFFLSSFILSNT